MKKIAFALLLAALMQATFAENAEKRVAVTNKLDPRYVDSVGEDFGKMSTRYGLVQYRKNGSEILVNGKPVYDNTVVDKLKSWGLFSLDKREVLLFEGSNLGSGGSKGETFFLLLMPDLPPKILQARISPLTNPITKVWQQDNVIFVDFATGDYEDFKPPLKLIGTKVVVAKASAVSVNSSLNRAALKSDDCSRIYEISSNSCTKISRQKPSDCAKNATSKGWIGDSNAESGYFNWIAQQRGFTELRFNEACQAWCAGQRVSYEQFSSMVCNIK